MNNTDHDLLQTLKKTLKGITLREPENIHPETLISELGLDSVALMELIGILEEDFSIRISNEEVAELHFIRDILSLVRDRMSIEVTLPAAGSSPEKASRLYPAEVDHSADWVISKFPEVKKLDHRFEDFERMGVKNPYFEVHDGIARNRTSIGRVEMINFSSYNYLGFSGHPEVAAAAKEAIDRYGTSVSASRLVSGERPIHRSLERALADHIGVEDAVVFVSGHATNVTTIGHLFDQNDLILYDSLCHDSIIQGINLSGAKRKSFVHGNVDQLERILVQMRGQHRRVLICSEGLFSMDGDICNLPRLINIKKRFHCNLFVDEAHSIGVLGPAGRGISHHFPGINPNDVDLWMGTLSKSLASCGGFIAGDASLVRYLKFTAPGFLFSVGISPPIAAAALKSLELMQQYPEIVEQLRQRSKLFLDLAQEREINTGNAVGAAVVPAIIGDSMKCVRISQALAAKRINVQPIIHPAVEENAARLRFFISATHSEDEIRYGVNALAEELKKH